MLSVSSPSPAVYPPPSSPPRSKRVNPHDGKGRVQVRAGFMMDDDSDGDETDEIAEPAPKKRMLDRPAPDLTATSAELAASVESTASGPEFRLGSQQSSRASAQAVIQSETQEEEERSLSNALYSQVSTFRRRHRPSLLPGASSSPLGTREYAASTCCGHVSTVKQRETTTVISYERMAAARSKTKEGRATESFYGVDILRLIDAAKEYAEEAKATKAHPPTSSTPGLEPSLAEYNNPAQTSQPKPSRSLLWTEKYRARSFIDLCGDDGTNRLVLRWLKRWDPLVFPGTAKKHAPIARRTGPKPPVEEEKAHRKILMVTGPPGLGKTTLAHVCARQAGYEVLEVNASDDRSRDVVQNRIRTSLGTENVKAVANQKAVAGRKHKVARPVCVVVDEVDGAVSGSGGSGEGGFVKALIDLVLLDQRNSGAAAQASGGGASRKKKGDDFRLRRPLILICNDVYHPSLRPLRQSGLAEIVHAGKPTVDAVAGRLKAVLEKEGITCDKDAARTLCEAAWGMPSGIDARRGAESSVEGDLRSAMVVGEWVAGRFKASPQHGTAPLTRQWIEQNVLHGLAGAAGARGLGRSGTRDIVSRIFQDGGGFPKQTLGRAQEQDPAASAPSRFSHEQPKTQLGFSEPQKRHAIEQLRQMVDASGEVDRIVTDIFAEFPGREFNDDSFLSKPTQAYEWLHFHDACSSRLFSNQNWELSPYLSQASLACHHLFASSSRHVPSAAVYDRKWGAGKDEETAPPAPFSGPRADYSAYEAEKHSRAQLQTVQGQLGPTLMRSFRSPESVAMDLLPYLVRLVSPDVKPVVVGGSQGWTASVRRESEKTMVKRAAEVLADVGIGLLRGKIESDVVSSRGPQYVYRLEPDLDTMSVFETASTTLATSQAPTRYAVRQVLAQELQRTLAARANAARQARFRGAGYSHPPTASSGGEHAGLLGARDEGTNSRPGIPDMMMMPDGTAVAPPASRDGPVVKRDFFGRVVVADNNLSPRPPSAAGVGAKGGYPHQHHHRHGKRDSESDGGGAKVWVTYNEGLNNAVRKPISLQEFMRGL